MGNLIEIAQFFDPEEAYCANSYLQSRGINTIIKNEHHLNMVPWLRIALGGYRLQVMIDNEQAATQALKDISAMTDAEKEAQDMAADDGVYGDKREGKNWVWLPVAFLSGVPFLPTRKTGLIGLFQFLVLALFYAGIVWMIIENFV